MTPTLVATIMAVYFGMLILIAYITSRGADTNTFFTGNRQSPWYLVAFGMIGSSLSGLTFISVPGKVGVYGYGYFQVIMGNLVGYWLILGVLMPLYYRLNLVSIYTYLDQRLGTAAYKTGAFFFVVSRTIGSSLRLYLAATVLQLFLFDEWNVPFYVTVAITILLIWIYTFKGGVKTIVWTDSFQTLFLVSAVCIAVWQIASQLGLSPGSMIETIRNSNYSKMFYLDDPNAPSFFFKEFLGGVFITLTMTGMDQELMQKNLTVKTLGGAQKNMFWFSLMSVAMNLLFLTLGALLYLYMAANPDIAMPTSSDHLFPMLALDKLGLAVSVFFLLGITASSYASADSALAGLTTSFCIDFLNFKNKEEKQKRQQKFIVHLGFSLLFLVIIIVFNEINKQSVIDAVLKIAGYTYGPLLGLFSFGLLTKLQVRGKLVPIVCILSPAVTYAIAMTSETWLGGYKFGLEVILLNGTLTFLGLLLISKPKEARITI